MTRRDIIIVATLVNAGLLAVLFMLATNSDDDKVIDPTEISQTVMEIKPIDITPESSTVAVATPSIEPGDEVDNALREFAANNSAQNQVIIDEDVVGEQEEAVQNPSMESTPAPTPAVTTEAPETKQDSDEKCVDVTVKRGDSLDRIARANGTTVQAIKDASHLKSDKLKVGQVLQVPVSSTKPAKTKTAKSTAKAAANKAVAQSDVEYYTVKSGDNPWKIAKQFHIKVDDLLKLNNLDEEKARNLKIGDRVRVK